LRGFMSSARRSIVSHVSSATSNSSVRLNSFASSSQIQLSPATMRAHGSHLVPPINVNAASISGGRISFSPIMADFSRTPRTPVNLSAFEI
jgi:hypothetical protein